MLAALPPSEKADWMSYKSREPSLILTMTKQGIKLWDPLTLAPRGEMPGARTPLAFSRDGRTAVTGGGGDTAILWDISGL